MNARRTARAGAAALVCVASACAPPKPRATGPSLLLVTLDTVRADRLGCYGRATAATPTLDRLAREGARFERAYAAAPLTLPSHASMLTGLYPNRHGLRDNGAAPLPQDVPTLAETLRDLGYDTAAFVSGAPLDHRFGLDRGFERYDDKLGGRTGAYSYPERRADRTTAAALEWLAPRLASTAASFALWVHYFDPHAPYAPPPPFADRFRDAPYEGEIAFVDSELGRLVGAIEKAGRLDRTVIVVVSDHGEGLGEHGERTHGCLLYDSTLRVPLLVRAPGRVAAGSVRADRVGVVDLLPTALALLDVPAAHGIDGIDRSHESTSAPPVLFAECLSPFFQYDWAPLFSARDSQRGTKRIWDGSVKLLTSPDADPAEPAVDGDAAPLDGAIAGYQGRKPAAGGAPSAAANAALLALGYVGSVADVPAPSTIALLPSVSTRLATFDAITDAMALRHSGSLDEASVHFERVLRDDPNNPGVRFLLANVRRELASRKREAGDATGARQMEHRALSDLLPAATARPRDARFAALCAALEMQSADADNGPDRRRELYLSAESRLEAVVRSNPEDTAAWFLLANVHSLPSSPLADLDKAIEELGRVLKSRPDDPHAKELYDDLRARRRSR